MRKTNFTLGSKGRSGSKADGKQKIAFRFALFFLLAFMANQVWSQCSITCNSINISVGQSCEADLHWSTLAAIPAACNASPTDDDFFIRILDTYGTVLAQDTGNVVVPLSNYIGDSITFEVYYIGGGTAQQNYCWSNALVEDKQPPVFACDGSGTVSCLSMLDEPFPTAIDNCSDSSEIQFVVTNRRYVPLCDSNFIKLMIREFVAIDASGNVSDVCVDSLFFERFDIDSIEAPPSYTADSSLLCNGAWDTNNNGYPDVEEVGVPTYKGIPLYPEDIESCNVQFTFSDVTLPIPCGLKVMRTWRGMEWCPTGDRIVTLMQMIHIVDTLGPEVTATVDTIMVSTGIHQCDARVVIPEPVVVDNCNEVDRYVVSTNAPAVPVEVYDEPQLVDLVLPAGIWEVYLTAYDNCHSNNPGRDTVVVYIKDQTPPVVACDEHTVVSLTADGRAKVWAATFDDGSWDECSGIDSFSVRRMGAECDGPIDDFGPYVEFCCDDIANNPIMVVFRAVDKAGNANECMVEVNVQDKLPAYIQAPDDITISCEFVFDENNLEVFGDIEQINGLNELNDPALDPRDSIIINDPGSLVNGPEFKTLDGYAFDNCAVTIDETHELDIDECGFGTITRTFTAVGGGNSTQAVDVQVITVVDFTPFSPQTINFPEDLTITNNCNISGDLTPEFLRDSLGFAPEQVFPTYDDGNCSQVARNYEDHFFPIDDPSDPACYKILRTWKILDWCTYQPGGDQPFVGSQVIKVMNSIAPTWDNACNDTVLLSVDGDCSSRYVELVQEATDDCTAKENLEYSYQIDAFNDGDFDIFGSTNDASDEYPVGEHRIIWTVFDQCGNSSTCSYLFEIESRKGPTPVCRNLTVEVMPVDTDGDGTIDDGMLDIFASHFDFKSFHACGFDVTVSFSADPLDTMRTLTCDNVGVEELEIWVHATNGTSSFCRTYAIVQANNGACGPGNTGPTFPIAGTITNPQNSSALPKVDVMLDGSSAIVETETDGSYTFQPMPEGGRYTVMPERNSDLLNGVNSIDILLMQRHILEIDKIDNPYTLIAADVNNDGNISGSDIIATRRAILGVETSFPNNKSWRFVDADYLFTTTDPLSESFPESYHISNLGAPMMNINFNGVKIGDINGDADETVNGRSGQILTFVADNMKYQEGDIVRIPVRAKDFDMVQAYQFTLSYDQSSLVFEGVESGVIDVDENGYAHLAEEHAITMLWADVQGLAVTEEDVLFTLQFKATAESMLGNSLTMNSKVTEALAVANGDVSRTVIEFRGREANSEFELFQNTPNPFANSTIVGFNLPEATTATLHLFDVTGKELQRITRSFSKGYNQIELNRSSFDASGILYYRLDAGKYSATKKMVVIE